MKNTTSSCIFPISGNVVFHRKAAGIMGKLSVAKTQEKTPTTPGTAMKKKEDIQL